MLQVDVYSQVATPLLAAVTTHCSVGAGPEGAGTSSGAAAGASGGGGGAAVAGGGQEAVAGGEPAEKPLPLPECLKCLATAWQHTSAEAQRTHGAELSSALAAVLTTNQTWQARLAALAATQQFIKTLLASAAGGSEVPLTMNAASPWVSQLVPGVLSCLDIKVLQLRQAAMATCEATVGATIRTETPGSSGSSGGAVLALDADAKSALLTGLSAFASSTEDAGVNVAIKATAAQLVNTLSGS